MVNFKLGQEMKNDVINMSRVWDKEKFEKNPRQELNPLSSVHQSDALTTELRRSRGELGHIQG